MIKLNDLLQESLTDIVYHYTNIDALVNIVKSNKFGTTLSLGSSSDLKLNNKNKFYYFSTTRSKADGYYIGHDVCLVLNGKKLNHKYKGSPVDYWAWSKNPNDWNNINTYKLALKSEQEDRIILDKPSINNALQYIIAIHIYVDPKYPRIKLNKILYINNNIPKNINVFYYNNEKYFRLQATNKQINPDESLFRSDDEEEYIPWKRGNIQIIERLGIIISVLAYNDESNYKKIISLFEPFESHEQYNIIKNAIDTQIKEVSNKFNYTYINELYNKFRNDIHLYSKEKHQPIITNILFMLAKDLKKYNCENLMDYMKYKFDFFS